MPDWKDPNTGRRMVWDPDSHSYVEAEEYKGDHSHATPGDEQDFDPAVHRMTPKNPLQEGILASIQNCRECGGPIARDGFCSQCGEPQADFASQPPQHHYTDPFPDAVPIAGRTPDNSFPSMMSHRKSLGDGTVRSEPHRGLMQTFSNDAPTLEACPECGDPMIDSGDEAVCHSCGHRQPIMRIQARTAGMMGKLLGGALALAPLIVGKGGLV